MNLFQILNSDNCGALTDLVGVVKFALSLIQFIIPVVLIIFITVDLFRAMTGGKEEEIKKAKGKAINRMIYAIVIFLVPFIVDLSFDIVGRLSLSYQDQSEVESFFTCWENYDKEFACYHNDTIVDGVNTKAECKGYGVSKTGVEWREKK